MRIRSIGLLALVVALGSMGQAMASVATFDDLPDNGVPVPNGYGGLNWENFYYLNGDTYGSNPSGYQNGVVSHYNVAYNAFSDPAAVSDSLFTFNSAYFTAAWNDGLSIEVIGYLGGTPIYDTTFVVNTSGPTLKTFNWSGIDRVYFRSSGGVNHGYDGSGEHFAMDNFTYNESSVVPEPATIIIWSLLGAGSWLGMRVWRRRGRVGVTDDVSGPAMPTARRPWSPEARQAIHEIIARGSH